MNVDMIDESDQFLFHDIRAEIPSINEQRRTAEKIQNLYPPATRESRSRNSTNSITAIEQYGD